jgi:protein SCO1/2
MKIANGFGLWALVIALSAAGCGDRAASPREYEVRGKVISVTPEEKTVRLDHEAIPGVMKAMTMNFRLEDPNVAKDVAPGDQVRGRLRVQAGGYVITSLERITAGAPEK